MNARKIYERLKREYFKMLCQRIARSPDWDGKIGFVEATLWLSAMGVIAYAFLMVVIKAPIWVPTLVWYAIDRPAGTIRVASLFITMMAATWAVVIALSWLNTKWIVHECDLVGRDATAAEIPAFPRHGGELEPPSGGKALEEAVGVRQGGS